MTGATPKVFISYSHDTVMHQERVLDLADRLRADGIDAEIDQYNAAPPEGWPRWCERQIEAADVVLMVCTETYHRRVKGDEKPGTGLGVVWEAAIIRQLLYDAGAVSTKFVPVLFSDASDEQIPMPIKGWTRYVVDTEDGYEELYRRLTGQPRLLRPALGTIRPMPTRRRQWPAGTMEAASSSPAPGPTPAPKNAWREWLGRAVATIKRFGAAIVGRRPRKHYLAVTGGVALLVLGGIVYSCYEPQTLLTHDEGPPPLPGPFETNTEGIMAEVIDFSMTGEWVRLSVRLFADADIQPFLTRICIDPKETRLVDERTGQEWKAESFSHSRDCHGYQRKERRMYWMSFHIGQDMKTTFTAFVPGLSEPVKGLEPR